MHSLKQRSRIIALLAALLTGLGIYHILILAGLLPSQYVWLGRIQTPEELLLHEGVSLGVIALALAALTLERFRIYTPVSRLLLYLFALLFAANTVANLFAPTWTERILFTAVTSILTLLTYRLIQLNKEIK